LREYSTKQQTRMANQKEQIDALTKQLETLAAQLREAREEVRDVCVCV
jgi:polyhydroxyalkanoate synthesis regulator phasin